MRNQVFKKLFSVLLALIMVAGLLPASVLAEGEGNADSTPAPTEAVQPTESAEPTAPTETETPEVTEVPEPTPENPATTVEPTQGEPTAEPTDEGIMPANVMPVQAATENNTAFTVDETKALERESVSNVNYRAVMLDCGRKYFSVENIKKLIDTMAQYGYNQLQLSFGNGGCRFLLDDMSLSFKDVTMVSDTVKTNITDGNYSFNGDKQYLSQTDMDAIITYAEEKGIEIVPMLNMPGHATAIVYNTNYSSSGNLIINNETSRYYGYALLKKYAEYFAGKGCKYFSFGADESGYTGDNMTAFLTGCANVIVEAGMIPRAFNDSTYGATMPKSVQITYWHQEKNSKSASALANDGYEMINTHGRWYYVIKTAQNSESGTKYWQGTVRTTETSVELPVMKATKMDNGTWVGLNEYFDANPGYGSTIAASKGTMFCIWCDASQDTYLTDSDVISENENYGALYQLQKLAEHYWGDELNQGTTPIIKMDDNTDIPASIKVGESITLKADKEVSWETTTSNLVEIAATRAVKGTTATITAKAAGDAVITATADDGGMTEINLKVTANGLENIDPLKVELWVTNRYAGGTHNGVTYAATAAGHIVPVSAAAAYGPDGVTLESLVPTNGKDEGDLDLLYWKGTRLGSSNKQTYTGTDRTGSGSDFQRIRYYEDSWQYYFNNNWVSVENGDQIIAYYMQVYNTSPEIVTAFRDYGGIAGKGGGEHDASWFAGYRGVGTAVVYSDKSMSPDGDDGIWNTTLICYYEGASGGGTPGLIKVFDTEDFKITKITITKGVHKDSTGATGANATKTWNRTTSSILWDKTINDAGDKWYKETLIWTSEGHTPGETITLDDSIWGDTWKTSGIGEAFLLLFYVEPVEKEDNLNVVYWDDNAKVRINPNDITISVKAGTTFINGIKQNSQVNAGTFTLDDDATIENSVGVNQKFNKNITILDGVAANYRSGIYEYVSADISEDGKTLTLHYNLKKVDSLHRFVVDFGLPVTFTDLLSWFHVDDYTTVEYLSVSKTNKLTESTGSWGSIKIDTKTWNSMTYTLDKMLSASATIPLYCKLVTGSQIETQIQVIPATNVYYEDSFAKFTGGAGAAASAQWKSVNENGEEYTATYPEQALEALGQENHKPYGYDPAYDSCTMFSMGSARKVTVTQAMVDDWNNHNDSAWPTAQFTFKGTGFDIISLTDNTSGAIFVFVYKGTDTSATGTRVRSHIVDNYYGYTQDENGNWVVNNNANNVLYQIPVMRIRDLEYGEYTAVVKVFYDEGFNHTTKSEYSFWLDAVRVYDPMGESVNTGNTYGQDGEAYPQYIKLRSELKKLNSGETASSGALFIDGKENANISEYANYGPNNEVYLAKGQAIMFKLAGTDLSKIETVQIGAKAPNGTAKLVVNNGEAKVLGTATEMYYDITMAAVNNGAQLVTVTNTGEAILSLTNLKITYAEGNQTVSLGEVSAEQKTQAVQMVRALFAPAPVEPEPEPEPEKTFEPERFEASWSRNVMQGRKATLTVKTSEDVEAITVDGQTIRSYRTRTDRVGFGRRAKRITYREFTYSMVAQESADFSVTAINAEGTESEAITTRLTVKTRPNSLRDMWDWFKGWF